jgi:hypothetical protein
LEVQRAVAPQVNAAVIVGQAANGELRTARSIGMVL